MFIITVGESTVAIPKPIAKPLFLASLAYACSGGTISENSGPVMYDLRQQSGIQVPSDSTLSSMVLGEVNLIVYLIKLVNIMKIKPYLVMLPRCVSINHIYMKGSFTI